MTCTSSTTSRTDATSRRRSHLLDIYRRKDAVGNQPAILYIHGGAFDRYLEGHATALGDAEVRGLELFMNKGCAACHGGLNVGGGGYFPFGVLEKPTADVRPPDDLGRYEVTRSADDEYVFKSPSLRNVTLTAPYFHSGTVWELEDAVTLMGSAQLGATLTEDEVASLVAFLGSLTGEQPDVEYPLLPTHTDATPLPVTAVEPAGTSD